MVSAKAGAQAERGIDAVRFLTIGLGAVLNEAQSAGGNVERREELVPGDACEGEELQVLEVSRKRLELCALAQDLNAVGALVRVLPLLSESVGLVSGEF